MSSTCSWSIGNAAAKTTGDKPQEPATEQDWLGNETDGVESPTRDLRLRRIERTANLATMAFEDGEFEEGVKHLENALGLALIQRALDTTTEGLKQ